MRWATPNCLKEQMTFKSKGPIASYSECLYGM